MDPEEPKERETERISRRSALTRIGAGAAIAWSAPILSSIRTPAFAQQYDGCSGGPGRGCAIGGADCGGQPACGGSDSCSCLRTTEGTCFCHLSTACAGLTACASTADCPAGLVCAFSCCAGSLCLPPCVADAGAGVRGAGTSSGARTSTG